MGIPPYDEAFLAPCKHCGVVPVLHVYELKGQSGFSKPLYTFNCLCDWDEPLFASEREAYETWNEENKNENL